MLIPSAPAQRARIRVCVLLLVTLALGAIPIEAHAQSSRAGFFLQMLRQNPDARVRVSAALRLQELRERATVPPILQAFGNERDPTVLAAMVSALGAIGDPAALPTVQGALRHPNAAVAAQARRALPVLQAAASAPTPGNNGVPPANGATAPRLLVGVGTVNNQSGVRGQQLSQVAQAALQNALQNRAEVVVHSGSAAQAQSAIRQRRLTGHYFDANIQSLQPRGSGVRAAVSIAVSTYPGRAYEFEASTTVTISGGSSNSQTTEEDAVRRAIEAAANRAIQQLLQGSP